MAVLSVEITQDNIIGGVNLMSVHNPLVFIVNATHDGTAPDVLNVVIETDTYRCIYLNDLSPTERNFMFISEEALRFYMSSLTDYVQSLNSLINVPNLIKEITLAFSEPISLESDSVDIIAAHASRDFEDEDGATMVDTWNNEPKYYVGALGQDMYVYWWNDDANNTIGDVAGFGRKTVLIGATADLTAANIVNLLTTDPQLAPYFALDESKDAQAFYFPESPPSFPTAQVSEIEGGGTFSNLSITASITAILSGSNVTVQFGTGTTPSIQPLHGDTISFRLNPILVAPPSQGYVNIDLIFSDGVSPLPPATGNTMDKGFIRKKINPTVTGLQSEVLTINGVDYPQTINVREFCEGSVLVKYVNRDGEYRFFPFIKEYTRVSNPRAIGDIEQLILSLKDGDGDTKQIGYINNDILTLKAQRVNSDELEQLKDLYNSHEVFIILNGKEIRVKVSGDNISKLAKRKFTDVTIQARLPKSYNVGLL